MQVLGHEVGNIYTRSELKHLIQIHVENPQHQVHAIPLVMILFPHPRRCDILLDAPCTPAYNMHARLGILIFSWRTEGLWVGYLPFHMWCILSLRLSKKTEIHAPCANTCRWAIDRWSDLSGG